MLLEIKNEQLALTVDTLGAQMMSLKSAEGIEYLWQGDPAYWKDRAPVLFPFIGRLTENSYQYHGKRYHMGIHGFAASCDFSVAEHSSNRLELELCSNEATAAQYPFDFIFCIGYSLRGNTLDISYRVQNRDNKTMPFAIGGHPGFNVPLLPGESFEDYELEFSQECQPDRVGFTPQVYLSGQDTPYHLTEGKRIALRHDLFDEDAVILKNMAREVTLRSKVSGRGVRVSYLDMPYLGVWHMPKTDAPYVCVEPWSSLPARQDIVEEFSCKSDLLRLTPKKTCENIWSVTVL